MSGYNINGGYGRQNDSQIVSSLSSKLRLSYGKILICVKSTDTDNFDRLQQMYDPDREGTVRFFTSIVAAVAVAQDWDTIVVGPGDWDEGEVIAITQEGLKIVGPGMDNQHVAMIYSSSASHHLMTINANQVEIAGLGFTQTVDTYSGIMCATTAAAYKIHIHDCRFDGYGQGEYGVHGGTTYDTPDIVVENNVFRSWQTAAAYIYSTRGIIRKNNIVTVAAKIGILLPATGSNRGGVFCTDNDILGVNSTDTGISVAAVDAGMLFISGNRVCGCGTADITQFANGQYSGTENYAASTAGGALIDIDS